MRDIYEELLSHFSENPDVELPKARGAQGLKYRGNMFAMFYKGDLTVKLPGERVADIISSGEGQPHDPGTGKPMKDRVLIPASGRELWIGFCEESLKFVKGGK